MCGLLFSSLSSSTSLGIICLCRWDSEVESEMDEELDDSSEPQAKERKRS